MGLLTSATLGAFSGGVGSYAASYDALGRLTSSQDTYTPSGGSASTLYAVAPTYDALGNVIETVPTLSQGTDTQVFCYDDLSRLTWAGSSGTPTCAGAPTPGDTDSLPGTGGAGHSASYGAAGVRPRSARMTCAALRPGAPETEPPGCVQPPVM